MQVHIIYGEKYLLLIQQHSHLKVDGIHNYK